MMQPILASLLAVGLLVGVQVAATHAADKEVFVDAENAGWVSPGVVLGDRDRATITATGTAICNVNEPDDCTTGPDGADATTARGGLAVGTGFLAPGLPRYALVAQVDNADPVFVGAGPTTVAGPGELFLGYNDDVYRDNRGGYDATIAVESGSGKASKGCGGKNRQPADKDDCATGRQPSPAPASDERDGARREG